MTESNSVVYETVGFILWLISLHCLPSNLSITFGFLVFPLGSSVLGERGPVSFQKRMYWCRFQYRTACSPLRLQLQVLFQVFQSSLCFRVALDLKAYDRILAYHSMGDVLGQIPIPSTRQGRVKATPIHFIDWTFC